MQANQLRAMRHEPSCAHRESSQAGCARPPPGATQGGCCFDGARNALVPISDVAHIVHGPIGCSGSSWDTRGSRSSGSALYRIGLTTALTDVEMVMGTSDQRLLRAIHEAICRFSPAAVFVYVTCVPAMHGADVEAVTRSAQTKWGVPVIAIDCAGYYGNKNFGQRIAGDALLRHVIGTRDPDPIPEHAKRPDIRTHDVNLIGEWNVGGEFWSVAPLFDELGLRILCTLSGDSRFRDVQAMHRAEANMVVCSKALLRVAHTLKQTYGSPFFEGSFYGIPATSAALRSFALAIDDADLIARTEHVVAREERRASQALAPLRARLKGKRALIFTGGFKSWSTVSAVQDLGMTVVATGIEKSTDEDKARIRQLMGPDARMLENNDQEALLRTFEELRADILIAGDRYIYPSLKARVPFLDLDHVRTIGYAGYPGAVEFGRQVVAAVEHPIWAQVRQPPPWELDGSTTRDHAA
ncbi:MAG: nitrogenase iron-molybdenum cofactor biosynthesis protein NifE [Polyangiaceae bacterium]|jgi:nitrogenase molybdenum-cofactor synthesis protein NifE